MVKGIEDLAFRVRLQAPYQEALQQVTAALKEQGFGVLTKIDVQATLKEKLDASFRPYTILGVCNPQLAHRALMTDLAIGLMLPCTVVVYEEGAGSVALILDPISMLHMVQNPALEPVAQEARARLQRVAQGLEASKQST